LTVTVTAMKQSKFQQQHDSNTENTGQGQNSSGEKFTAVENFDSSAKIPLDDPEQKHDDS